ncbi:hypothetical protein HDV57DRAFT_517498 [Trichoderma longibrachiatum]|uniref:Uncharacterized protein n=1 Tax=Trichoderma longibrachiatum ATCC 18648 TaxID=983965 RepID=A0A2T4CF95_TRILO|nr:hypothetical protein M440DRAFT_1418836 [Trichoderma longibrachiatum ATCC 18648]
MTSAPASSSSSPSSTSESSPQASLSLYGIARRYCREEILVTPLRWTGRHLELLQCSFDEPLPEPTTAAAYSTTEADFSEQRSGTPHLEDFFRYYYKAAFREQGIRLLLTRDGCPLIAYDSIRLYFNGCVAKRMECVCLCLRGDDQEALEYRRPVAGFIDRSHIELMRKETIGYRSRHYNPPILRLYNKKWRKINPPEPLYDPYIVALLIGVAQQKRRHIRETNPDEETVKGMVFSQVLSTFYSKGQSKVIGEEAYMGWMYLYQANIPSSLLDMFDDANAPPSAPPSVSVQVITISYAPLATLRARLLELLLPETLATTIFYGSSSGRKRKYDGQGMGQSPGREAPSG